MPPLASKRSLAFITLGLGVQASVAALAPPEQAVRLAFGFVSGALLVYGCAGAARDRGYTPWLGFAGLLSFLGAGFLLLLPEPGEKPILRWFRNREAPREG